MENVLFICVVYSKEPEKTKTINSYRKVIFSNYGIMPSLAIWDNSKAGFTISNELSESIDNLQYYHTGNNEKLSVIYNAVIDKNKDKLEWVVILDDDSVIDCSYAQAVQDFVKSKSNAKVAIPKIFLNNTMISPGFVKGVRGFALKDISNGVSEISNLVAMMSGTVINFKDKELIPTFDERLSFYGVDTRFFREVSKLNLGVYIMPVIMQHESALRDISIPFKEKYRRHCNLLSSKKYVFDDIPLYKLRVKLFTYFFAIKQIIRSKDIRYAKLFLEHL